MNEDTNISAMSEDTAPETESTSAMDDDWGDIDLSDVKDDTFDDQEKTEEETADENPEADQQTEEAAEESEEDPVEADDDTAQESAEEQETFDLKFLGETKTVSREEVITLAQKGLNYDKVLGERDNTKAELERLGGMQMLRDCKELLDELASESKMSVEDLIDSTRAEVLAKKEGLDQAVALQRVKLDRREKAFEAKQSKTQAEQKAKEEADKKQQEDLHRFIQAYPEVKAQDIPKEVWDKVHGGVPLVTAYSIYENKKLREEVKSWKDKAETAEQNAKNKERSTGSQSTAGMGSKKKKDPIDLDWYDGT